jgi:hypothetical protein
MPSQDSERLAVFEMPKRDVKLPRPKRVMSEARRERHNCATHVEIVPIRSVDALVAVAFHQRFDFTALGFLIVVLDSQRAYLVFVEWKTLQCLELRSFNVKAHVMNESRSLRAFEDVTDGSVIHLEAVSKKESADQCSAAYFGTVQYPGSKTCTPYPPSTQRG